VTYYVDGHADKITADVAWITAEDDGNFQLYEAFLGERSFSEYPGYWSTADSDGLLVRFQWQLAL
jgi:hypothetical protein